MKLSLPRNSIGSCLLALAAALILLAPAAHATPMTFFANLSSANDRSGLHKPLASKKYPTTRPVSLTPRA